MDKISSFKSWVGRQSENEPNHMWVYYNFPQKNLFLIETDQLERNIHS